ncbi:tail spike protein head-binding protein [Serratia phage 2050H1]|uniref:Tail spike protein head-binding protein n=1 Tax=Serratia phage 2050H1 TaxID=2024250 RepID=A0A249Y2B0_9CAUD|nr:tail spike protein head-binding protein [Serratia phage 2050H1]
MNPRFTQPKSTVSEMTNLAAVSRIFGYETKNSEYIHVGLDIGSYKVVFDDTTSTCWLVKNATGNVVSYSRSQDTLVVVTSVGTFKLNRAKAVDMELLFKSEQHLQYYYDLLGNWDDAFFMAQVNVFLKGYSPRIILPVAEITITRPILNGVALGDKIHATYPELNFYNSTTGNYLAAWPLVIHGTYRKQQDGGLGGYSGSQIIFRGCNNRDDMTWTQWAIIHSGPNPTEVGQLRRTDTLLKNWPAFADLRDFNIRAINKDGVPISNVHGMYFHYGTQVSAVNMSIYQCYGAGVAVDNTWDSKFENLKVLQCGRMSPVFGQYVTDGNFGPQYQTYAPIHVMRSPLSDNSNFIRFHNCHVEDNIHAAVDVIVSGNSSPVWLTDLHVEAQTGLGGTTNNGQRTIVGLGNFGVTYFGQDAQPGYDYKARPDTGTGGNVVWTGGGMYSDTYSHIARLTRYSAFVLSDMVFPNSGNINVVGGNAAPYVYLSNCVVGDISFTGGNGSLSPLKASNCRIKSLTMDYTYGPQLSNCEISGAFNITNMYSNKPEGGVQLTNCNIGSMSGVIQFGQGIVTLTSTTDPSPFVVYYGHIDVSRYAYYNTNNLVGG